MGHLSAQQINADGARCQTEIEGIEADAADIGVVAETVDELVVAAAAVESVGLLVSNDNIVEVRANHVFDRTQRVDCEKLAARPSAPFRPRMISTPSGKSRKRGVLTKVAVSMPPWPSRMFSSKPPFRPTPPSTPWL